MAGRIDIPGQGGFHPRLAKHYADGARQRIDDSGGAATVSPFIDGSEEDVAWQAGWDERDGFNPLTNPDFSGAAGWTVPLGWAILAGRAVATATDLALSQTVTIVEGEPYRVFFDVRDWVAGTVQPIVGGTAGTAVSGNLTYHTEVIIAGAGTLLEFLGDGLTADLDYVSLDDTTTVRDHAGVNYNAGPIVP